MSGEDRGGLPGAAGPGGWSVSKDRLETVNVPEQFVPIFLRAQQHVASAAGDPRLAKRRPAA